ncbi:MAG: ABC transporter permease [Alphaproteobacteria bacterium]|nr:ABC transporter permease [Alphaproteobacteria bacterium]
MRKFSLLRARAVCQKEFMHIFRDPFTLMVALLLPLLIVLILGNCIEFNIKHINLAYMDHDKTQSSRKLIETFGSSNYFKPYQIETPTQGMNELTAEKAKMLLIIPPDFEKEIMSQRTGTVQIILDGADNSSVSSVMNYLNTINVNAIYKIQDVPISKDELLSFKTRYLFNPELSSQWFSVPGITAIIIALVSIMLTTLTICREWEQGSMEMLLTTPIRSSEIIVGKLLPYALLSLIGFLIVFVVARLVFKVPFVGNFAVLLLGTLLFILGYLALGLFISIISHEQQVAVQYAALIGLMPTSLFSGVFFPVEYMAPVFQYIASVFPARFYVTIVRDQFLKGSTLLDLWVPFAVLLLQFCVLSGLCVIKFKRTLE